jgi:hypothetical protein
LAYARIVPHPVFALATAPRHSVAAIKFALTPKPVWPIMSFYTAAQLILVRVRRDLVTQGSTSKLLKWSRYISGQLLS